MMLKKIKPRFVLLLSIMVLTVSCEYGRQAEEQLIKINSGAQELDALVKDGMEKMTDLDSILPETSKKIKEADSIVRNASSTLDSLNRRVNEIQNIFE